MRNTVHVKGAASQWWGAPGKHDRRAAKSACFGEGSVAYATRLMFLPIRRRDGFGKDLQVRNTKMH